MEDEPLGDVPAWPSLRLGFNSSPPLMSTLDPEGLEKAAEEIWQFEWSNGGGRGRRKINWADNREDVLDKYRGMAISALTAYLQHKAAAVPQADELAKVKAERDAFEQDYGRAEAEIDFECKRADAISDEFDETETARLVAEAECAKVKTDFDRVAEDCRAIGAERFMADAARLAAEAECARLREALTACKSRFASYVAGHLAKGDGAKAQRNQDMVDLCVAALASPPAKEDDNATS